MKRTAIILTAAFWALLVAGATSADAAAAAKKTNARKITTENRQIEQSGDTVRITFDVAVGRRAARCGRTVLFQPAIVGGGYRWDLPEVMVQRALAKVARQRHRWAAGDTTTRENPTTVRGGERFRYIASVPLQGWMNGADLKVETVDIGCCSARTVSDLLAQNISLATPMTLVEQAPAEPAPEPVPATTGDLLAQEAPFVLHASVFEGTAPELMFDDDRQGALRIHFSVGSWRLEPGRGNNAETLRKLIEAIKKLQQAGDSDLQYMVIAGFASPEGSFALNDRLAWNRASILKAYITRNTGLDGERIHIYNGVEDWHGLKQMIEESDMEHRQAIIDVIESTPIHDRAGRPHRELELQKIDRGRAYRHMQQHFFPHLRQAAYIKIYYGNNTGQ